MAVKYKSTERTFNTAKRKSMDLSNFGDPAKRAFPVLNQQDLDNAAKLIGHADNPEAVKKRLIAIAKRKGLKIPDAWQPAKKEATTLKKDPYKLATLKTCFLEDDAISLNGRQYPKEAVDRLILSAQRRIADTQALPITCYLSHDKADQDSTRDIVGKVTGVWREGSRAYASMDIPDTTAGRDFVTLAKGGYIRSQSLRASGASMRIDANKQYPQVSGENLQLDGIDCTTMPGLPQIARIEDVSESASPQALQEVFHVPPNTMLLEGEMMNINEDAVQPLASGETQGVTSGPTQDAYSQRAFTMPPMAPEQGPSDSSLVDAHDRIAYVVGIDCAPSTMEAVARFGTAIVSERTQLEEAGAKLSAATKGHLMQAHDALAQHQNLPCAEPDGDEGSTPDSSQNDMQSYRSSASRMKENRQMDREEAARLLREAGYTIAPPKTKEQELEEKQIALEKKLEDMQQALNSRVNPFVPTPPQRRSLVEGATPQAPKRTYYRNGDYLREQLRGLDRRELLDRSRPLPDGIDPERLLNELQKELLGLYDARFGLSGDGMWAGDMEVNQ